jgi:hypothetical protein
MAAAPVSRPWRRLLRLSLIGIQVTDAGLKHLKAPPNLSLLLLNEMPVSDAGVKELQQALPGLWIIR